MTWMGHHIRFRLFDSRVIATTPEQQRLVTRIVLAQGKQDNLLCTSLSDDHQHLNALCGANAASRLVQRITSSVKQRLAIPVSFTHYPHEPIVDKRHLYYSSRYILTQQRRHGLPPLYSLDGTNLPDLLGMRLVGGYTRDNLQKWLPKLRREQLVAWAGLTALRTADGPLEVIVDAAMAAAGIATLRGSTTQVRAARRALIEVVGARLSSEQLAELLCVTPRSYFRLKHRPVDPALVRAIRLQLGARADLRAKSEGRLNEESG